MSELPGPLLQIPDDVQDLASRLRESRRFAIDLEFVSEGRYIPELCLVQVAWREGGELFCAAVDPLATDVRPIASLVEDPAIVKILHSAKGDLALLAERLEIHGRSIVDSQIAAGFLGYGEQIGFARLVAEVLGESVDKTEQFTDWQRRPLSDDQLRYALLDALHLLPIWERLEEQLEERGRLRWVEEESASLAADASRKRSPDEAHLRVKGGNHLRPKSRGVLRALAAWRERRALETNRPPGWILQDKVLLQLARRPPRRLDALKSTRGIQDRFVGRYGKEVLEVIRGGLDQPLEREEKRRPLPDWAAATTGIVGGILQERCRQEDIASRFVATRTQIDEILRWWALGDRDQEPDLPLLHGWRRELVGKEILDWLEGRSVVAHRPEGGLRVVPGGK